MIDRVFEAYGTELAALGGLALLLLVGLALRRPKRAPAVEQIEETQETIEPETEQPEHIEFVDDSTSALLSDLLGLALDDPRLDFEFDEEHASVVEEVGNSLPRLVMERQYLPRKPLVLPQLLRAVGDESSSQQDLAKIITQDPVLTADVLRIVNNPLYRTTKVPIESVSRAVVQIGVEGLKSLVSVSIMQPVFQVPKGVFDNFANIIWELAELSALAAQEYARAMRIDSPFKAHLLAMIRCISDTVLFRFSIDMYAQTGGLQPHPDALVQTLTNNADDVTRLLVEEWQLAEEFRHAADEYCAQGSVNELGGLAAALYYGRLAGGAALLARHAWIEAQNVPPILVRKGLPEDLALVISDRLVAQEQT